MLHLPRITESLNVEFAIKMVIQNELWDINGREWNGKWKLWLEDGKINIHHDMQI